MRRYVDLFAARDAHDGYDADQGPLAHEADLVGEDQVGRLSAGGLRGREESRGEDDDDDGRFSDVDRRLLRCVLRGCEFAYAGRRWTCDEHQVSHTCHPKQCGKLIDVTFVYGGRVGLAGNRLDCVVSKKRILDDEYCANNAAAVGSAKCILTNGLPQKHREALIYDSDRNISQNWLVMSKGVSRLDITRGYVMKMIADFVRAAVAFVVFIETEDFAALYRDAADDADDPKKKKAAKLSGLLDYRWWRLRMAHGGIAGYGTDAFCAAVYAKTFAALKLFIAVVHHADSAHLVGIYKKLRHQNDREGRGGDDDVSVHRLLMIPVLCISHILRLSGPYVDYIKMTKIFFKKGDDFTQATYTAVDKLVHRVNGAPPVELNFKCCELALYRAQLIAAIQSVCDSDSAAWSGCPGRPD